MKINLLIIGLVVSIFSFTGVALAHNDNQCNANNPQNCPDPIQICDNGEHIGNPHCQPTATPTPTIKVSCTPTPTKTDEDSPIPSDEVTPTAGDSATPTPTQFIYPTPTEGSGGYFDDGLGCGHHECSGNHTDNNQPNMPNAAPHTGRAE